MGEVYHSMIPGAKMYHVYFMFFRGHHDKYVKVGRTGNLPVRIRDLNLANPLELTNVFAIPCPNALLVDAMEYLFKFQLRHLQVKGEWFGVSMEFFEQLGRVFHLLNDPQDPLHLDYLEQNSYSQPTLESYLEGEAFPHAFDWYDIFIRPNNFQLFPVTFEGRLDPQEASLSEMIVLSFPEALDALH